MMSIQDVGLFESTNPTFV